MDVSFPDFLTPAKTHEDEYCDYKPIFSHWVFGFCLNCIFKLPKGGRVS